jgi:hypothetical protein
MSNKGIVSPPPWQFKIDETKTKDFESDFEENRRCLLNTYNSNAQNHGTFLIATAIGFLSLISTWTNFSGSIYYALVFFLLIIGVAILGAFMVFRIGYWTLFANFALSVTLESAISLFNEYNHKKNEPYLSKPPLTMVIQMAAVCVFRQLYNAKIPNKKLSLYQKLALRIARLKINSDSS